MHGYWQEHCVGVHAPRIAVLTRTHAPAQVRRAIEWLSGNHGEARRYAAALIARELAENAPAVFNVHVRAFIDAIWAGLRDQRLLVRDASVAALRVRCPGRTGLLVGSLSCPCPSLARCDAVWPGAGTLLAWADHAKLLVLTATVLSCCPVFFFSEVALGSQFAGAGADQRNACASNPAHV